MERRLIDANELERELANEYVNPDKPSDILTPYGKEIFNSGIDIARFRVRDAETIDAVEVVRCKDCKYFKFGDYCYHDGPMEHSHAREDDYCSYGVRRNKHA